MEFFREVCHEEQGTVRWNGLSLCEACEDSLDYWENLTSEERRREEEAVVAYTESVQAEEILWRRK
jgi:hypothetical protein